MALDIRSTGSEIAALFLQGEKERAVERLNAARGGQNPAVQDALDRYVVARTQRPAPYVDFLSDPAGVGDPDTHRRLLKARWPPRMPGDGDMNALTDGQRYDVYRSMVEVHGDAAAVRDLNAKNTRVPLVIRTETPTNTTGNQGGGVFDDRMVVLWNDGKIPHAQVYRDFNTEPSAQYDAQAQSGEAPFTGVAFRKADGLDRNGDGVQDMGRLKSGHTYAFKVLPEGHLGNSAFILTPDAVAAGGGRVQRDTNHDSKFDRRDRSGTDDLNDTFLIHTGGTGNTYSAGCQTMEGGQHDGFVDTMKGNPEQGVWRYVLVDARVSLDDPKHIDHGMYKQALEALKELAPRPGALADNDALRSMAGQIVVDAKAQGLGGIQDAKVKDGRVVFSDIDPGKWSDPAHVAATSLDFARKPMDVISEDLRRVNRGEAPTGLWTPPTRPRHVDAGPAHGSTLYAQALEGIEALGPRGYGNAEDRARAAATLATSAAQCGMKRIDGIFATGDDARLCAFACNPNNALDVRRAVVDKADAAAQPLDQGLVLLTQATAANASAHREQQTQQRSVMAQG